MRNSEDLLEICEKPLEIRAFSTEIIHLDPTRSIKNANESANGRQLLLVRLETSAGESAGEVSTLGLQHYGSPTAEEARPIVETLLAEIVGGRYSCRDLEQLSYPGYATYGVQTALLAQLLTGVELAGVTSKPSSVISIGASQPELLEQLRQSGYGRFKIKVSPETSVESIADFVERFPATQIDLDANASFSPDQFEQVSALLKTGIRVFEQPFAVGDTTSMARLTKQFGTGQFVSIDEAATSAEAIQEVLRLSAANAVCIKPFRFGGLCRSIEAARSARHLGAAIQVGGMLEAGLGRSLLLHLHSFLEAELIGDISPAADLYSSQPWPDLQVEDGLLGLPASLLLN